jgi:hypothetical protein
MSSGVIIMYCIFSDQSFEIVESTENVRIECRAYIFS